VLNGEYLIILVPVLLAILIIFYFIYHLWHTGKYSSKVLEMIEAKIEKIETDEVELSFKIKQLIESFRTISANKRVDLFDLERRIGIDMMSFSKKLDKELKKK